MSNFRFRFARAALVCVCVLPAASFAKDLYREGEFRPLTADRRALRVGDVLNVLVVENASAAASAGTKTDKSNDSGVSISAPGRQQTYGLGLDEKFDGSGKITRSGKILAQLSVSVVGVEANGDFRVKGDQLLEINGEKQEITLQGRVRPIDIGENNTIPSNRIADARITFVGDGILAESQHKGWLSRVLSFLGLI